MLLCWTIKSLSIPSAVQFYSNELPEQPLLSKKRVGANVREGGNKNCSSLYYSDSNSDTATGKTRIKARARLIERQRLESEAQLRKASEEEELDGLLDSDDYCLDSSLDINSEDDLEDEENEGQSLCESRDSNRTLYSERLIGAYILYFKELLSNNGRIFASVISITKTRAMVLSAIIEHVYFKN
ncbi:hypothetical protein HBI80_094300 [Parastagonospora nodorum]|nr:hypothetical protein HBI80_094300 [Parastagonospora nodorum]